MTACSTALNEPSAWNAVSQKLLPVIDILIFVSCFQHLL